MIGHSAVRGALEANLPPVVLLRGPDSVGKRTLAEHVLSGHGCLPCDFRTVNNLTAETSRDLKQFMSCAPYGHCKAAVVELDGASEMSLNSLLKVLEEPPAFAHFVLTSSRHTLPTIESRAQIYRMGLLSQEELRQVLVSRGMAPEAAAESSSRARGTVKDAMRSESSDEARAAVLSVLKAVADADEERLIAALDKWFDESHALLKQWVYESMTQKWRLFSLTDTFGLASDPVMLRQMLIGLSRSSRPKFTARSALMVALRRKG